jgi:hypothetical protein
MTTQVSPLPIGAALNGDQGGTGLDASQSAANLILTTTGNPVAPFVLQAPLAPVVALGVLTIQEQYASGVNAAAGSLGNNYRTLWTAVQNTLGVVVGESFSLPPGTYSVSGFACAYGYGQNQCALNDFNTGTLLIGQSATTTVAGADNTSIILGTIVVTEGNLLRLQQWIGNALVSYPNLGQAAASNYYNEVYASLSFVKLA